MGQISQEFFAREPFSVAVDLIGCLLETRSSDGVTIGRIVEAEAYAGPEDEASHAARLRTGNVRAMWGPPGIAYVYRSYGIHAMLNAVTGRDGEASAVLVRALEPVSGVELMERRRGIDDPSRLCRGPGALTVAMGITLDDHGRDLVSDGRLLILPADRGTPRLLVGPRIGISRAIETPWRVFAAGHPCVSAHRRGLPLDAVVASPP